MPGASRTAHFSRPIPQRVTRKCHAWSPPCSEVGNRCPRSAEPVAAPAAVREATAAPPTTNSTPLIFCHAGAMCHCRRDDSTVATPRRDAGTVIDRRLADSANRRGRTPHCCRGALYALLQTKPPHRTVSRFQCGIVLSTCPPESGRSPRSPRSDSIRATRSDREKIAQDDDEQLFSGTNGDARQTFV